MHFHRLISSLLGHGDGTLPESVPKAPAHNAEMAHTPCTSGAAPLGLDGPSVFAALGSGISALGANLLLDVKTDAGAATAQSVRLVMPLTKRTGTLRLEKSTIINSNLTCKKIDDIK